MPPMNGHISITLEHPKSKRIIEKRKSMEINTVDERCDKESCGATYQNGCGGWMTAGHDYGLCYGYEFVKWIWIWFYICFFHTNQGWDMCQNLNYEIKLRVDIEHSHMTFPYQKLWDLDPWRRWKLERWVREK